MADLESKAKVAFFEFLKTIFEVSKSILCEFFSSMREVFKELTKK